VGWLRFVATPALSCVEEMALDLTKNMLANGEKEEDLAHVCVLHTCDKRGRRKQHGEGSRWKMIGWVWKYSVKE